MFNYFIVFKSLSWYSTGFSSKWKHNVCSVWPCIWAKKKKTRLDLSTWIRAELCCWEGLRENDHSVSSLFVLDRGDKHSHPVSVCAGLKITLEWEFNHNRKASCSHGTENGDGPVSYSLSESALLNHSPGNGYWLMVQTSVEEPQCSEDVLLPESPHLAFKCFQDLSGKTKFPVTTFCRPALLVEIKPALIWLLLN